MNLSVDIEELFEDFELEDFVETISEFLPWHHWVQITLYGIIFIFGLIANIMVILVFLITLKVRILFFYPNFLKIIIKMKIYQVRSSYQANQLSFFQ